MRRGFTTASNATLGEREPACAHCVQILLPLLKLKSRNRTSAWCLTGFHSVKPRWLIAKGACDLSDSLMEGVAASCCPSLVLLPTASKSTCLLAASGGSRMPCRPIPFTLHCSSPFSRDDFQFFKMKSTVSHHNGPLCYILENILIPSRNGRIFPNSSGMSS